MNFKPPTLDELTIGTDLCCTSVNKRYKYCNIFTIGNIYTVYSVKSYLVTVLPKNNSDGLFHFHIDDIIYGTSEISLGISDVATPCSFTLANNITEADRFMLAMMGGKDD
jgi:hypothetical protein